MSDLPEGVHDGRLDQQAVFDRYQTPRARGEKADFRTSYLKPRAHAVAVRVFRQGNGLHGNARFDFPDAGEGVEKDSFLRLYLGLILDVLEGAPPTVAPMGAWGRGPVRTRLDDFREFALQILSLVPGDSEAYGVPGGRFGNEDGAAVQAGDACPARGDAFYLRLEDGLVLTEQKGVHGCRVLVAYV